MWTSRVAIVAIAVVSTAGGLAYAQTGLRGDDRRLRGDARQFGGDPRQLEGNARQLRGHARRLNSEQRQVVGRVRSLVGRPVRRGWRFGTVIRFKFAEHGLLPNATKRLNRLAAQLDGREVVKIRVDGHADAIGGPVYNIGLSYLRAARACDFLTDKLGSRLPRCRLVPHGESRPAARNDNPVGRSLNRRAVIVVAARPAGR